MAAQNFKTLIICIVGIYVTYLSYGIYQEKMYAPGDLAEPPILATNSRARTGTTSGSPPCSSSSSAS